MCKRHVAKTFRPLLYKKKYKNECLYQWLALKKYRITFQSFCIYFKVLKCIFYWKFNEKTIITLRPVAYHSRYCNLQFLFVFFSILAVKISLPAFFKLTYEPRYKQAIIRQERKKRCLEEFSPVWWHWLHTRYTEEHLQRGFDIPFYSLFHSSAAG